MSVKIMNLVWDSSVGPAASRLVLLALADYADDSGKCWPSIGTLAKKCGISPRSVNRCLADLEKAGYLRREQRFNQSNVYVVTPDVSSPPDRMSPPDIQSPPDEMSPHPLTERQDPPDNVGALTTNEPPVEPSMSADADREDVMELCSILQERMVSNGCRKPNITKAWKTDMRLLLDKDAVPFEVAKVVLEWSQQDSFWKGNIHSPAKFRKQFDKLKLRVEESGFRPPATNGSLKDWLRDCWKNADTRDIEQRSGLTYRQPDPPAGVDIREFYRQARKQWIEDHHDEIIRRIMAREASAA